MKSNPDTVTTSNYHNNAKMRYNNGNLLKQGLNQN